MVDPKIHNPKMYHKRDPLSFCEGAFKGLTAMLPRGVNVVRQGGTFAVSSSFPWLVFGRAIQSNRYQQQGKDAWLLAIYRHAQDMFQRGPEKTTLFLPSPSASGVSTINASAGVGGGVHEAGHVICDNANGRFPSFQEFLTKVGRHLDISIAYHECNFPKWVNVVADMRLEPGMALQYPEVEHRFHSIQTWVHNLEQEVRATSVAGDFMCALRDAGKGWVSAESQAVYKEYHKDARDMVEMLKPVWGQLKPKDTDWESSAHLSVYVAVEVINALHKLLKEPPPPPKGGGGDGDPNDEQGQDQSQGQDQDQSQGQGQDQSQDQSQGQGQGQGKSPMSLDDIRRLLQGEGEALDPSSAMKQDVKKNKQQLDHELYIPNGSKPIYRKFL